MIIDDKDYGYHYPLKVLRSFEKKSKLNIFALGDVAKLSAENAGFLVYVGVKAWADREGEDFTYSFEEFLDLVSLSDVTEAMEHLLGSEADEQKKR
jgi:hypothetical protein